jgi:hypothetical protein
MQKKNRGQGLIQYGLIWGLVCVVAIAACNVTGPRGISDGSYVGVVTGFSQSGIWYKTHEGDLLVGGQGTVTRSHWRFTVSNNVVADEVKKAMDKQDIVELKYHEFFWVWFWDGDTRYFVSSVKVVQKSPTTPAPPAESGK